MGYFSGTIMLPDSETNYAGATAREARMDYHSLTATVS